MRQWIKQYELDLPLEGLLRGASGRRFQQRGRTATAMGVLGGRAAIQETLQLRALAVDEGASVSAEQRVPIEEVKGVEVASHPFEEMLAESEREAGKLKLAQWVPVDRFFAFFPDPKGLFQMMEGGAAFIHESGASFTERKAAYRLKERYLERLGLSEPLMVRFLETGVFSEMAVFLPDLFLIDGTDITIVARTENPFLTKAALALLGVEANGKQVVKKDDQGRPVVWFFQDDILMLSTSVSELGYAQACYGNGANLGRSAELRYMLTQVPITPQTRVYTYFSDPFVRRLVGPAVKIGQVRRLKARLALEEATAASVLSRFDGHDSLGMGELVERGYLDPMANDRTIRLEKDHVSVMDGYGSVTSLASLGTHPVEGVSAAEKKAYDRYRDLYNRYWRRYFDPIAIRYEAFEDGRHELSTFILPLIDNSLYNGLKEILVPEKSPTALVVPSLKPEPVAMLSLNLNEDAWLEMIDEMSEPLEAMAGLDGAILDQLGPDFHVAVHDADPVLSLGSGELQGLVGRFGGRIDSDMTLLPLLVSVLTRPTSFLIGLQDPDLVRAKLHGMAAAGGATEIMGMGEGVLYRVTGEDRWIYKFSLEDLITIRFGIEVKDRYLVLTNLPFRKSFQIAGRRPAPNRAAHLTLAPRASHAQLPTLFASAVEKHRSTAMSGASCLVPILAAGRSESIAAAQEAHYRWFGFEPQHPVGGTWSWDGGVLESSLYGSPWRQEQPAYDPGNDQVGIMNRIDYLDLSMQFEHDGLRSTVRWWLKDRDDAVPSSNSGPDDRGADD